VCRHCEHRFVACLFGLLKRSRSRFADEQLVGAKPLNLLNESIRCRLRDLRNTAEAEIDNTTAQTT
jgi:hypothetical protein